MKYFLSVLILIIPTTLLDMSLKAQSHSFNDSWEQTIAAFDQILQEYNVVGGALVFLEKGEVKGSHYHGYAELSENRLVDENTIFHWASLTKTFTAVAVMQLRDKGLLTLDDPIIYYLPEIGKIHNPYGNIDEITIRMALNHSTGLRNSTWPWGGHEEWHPFEPTEWEQLAAMFPYTKIEFEPGSKHSYSNPAIIFLGKIIEKQTGDSWESYIEKNIFKPLGMNRSYFNHTPSHLLPNRSNSYQLRDGNPKPRGLDFHTGITTSNGGLNAPITDMLKYINFLLGSCEPEHEILNRSTLEEMWKEELSIEENDGIRSSVALSFFLEEFDGMRVIGHTGTQWSYYSWFYIHPETETAVISITNTDGDKNMHQFRRDVSRDFFRNVFLLYK
jgi:CubicO group peptidase (beta-lactamase class C family)